MLFIACFNMPSMQSQPLPWATFSLGHLVIDTSASVQVCAEDQGCQWKFSGKPFVSMVIFMGQSHAKTSTKRNCVLWLTQSSTHFLRLIPSIVFYELVYFNNFPSKGSRRTNCPIDSNLAYVCAYYFISTNQSNQWNTGGETYSKGAIRWCLKIWALL